MGEANQRKAATLYCAIDASQGFFCAPVALGHRSLVNVRFCCANAALDTVFATEAEAAAELTGGVATLADPNAQSDPDGSALAACTSTSRAARSARSPV